MVEIGGMEAKPKLPRVVRKKIRAKHYSYHTEEAYTGWIRRLANLEHSTNAAEAIGSTTTVRATYTLGLPVQRRGSARLPLAPRLRKAPTSN